MHKWFWYSLNPEEKFQRYKHSLWLLILAIIVLFIKFDLMIALGYSLVLIIFSYLGYKHFQSEAMAYKERKSCQKTL
ncbi:hypothetical protein [Massilimicrobiota sp. SW1139]|uniref:hypothetical protein n=1 Tax=Massilimicrobiota sp. SW1139 TaxID=2530043 RepID=UPI00143BA86B|nr:hypothetical protein [Massilimicrobiota sp. SW1139]NJE45509.1 hypothetical protein [Massilimicrobiota sp. SW1139]